MDHAKRQQAILFLDRNRFDLYEGASGRVLSFPFAPDVINALEVISPSSLENQLNAFLDQNSVPPANIVMVLSPNVLFEKDIVGLEAQQQEAQSQIFLDNVPFDSLITKIIPFDKGIRISTTNKSLCDNIKSALEKKGFLIEGVAPYESLGQNLYQTANLDNQNGPAIIKMYDSIKNNSFPLVTTISQTPKKNSDKTKKESDKKAPTKIRMFLMIGVFVLLIGIMVFVIFNPPNP